MWILYLIKECVFNNWHVSSFLTTNTEHSFNSAGFNFNRAPLFGFLSHTSVKHVFDCWSISPSLLAFCVLFFISILALLVSPSSHLPSLVYLGKNSLGKSSHLYTWSSNNKKLTHFLLFQKSPATCITSFNQSPKMSNFKTHCLSSFSEVT